MKRNDSDRKAYSKRRRAITAALAVFFVSAVCMGCAAGRHDPDQAVPGTLTEHGEPSAQDSAAGTQDQAAQQEYSLNTFYFDTVVSVRFDAGEDGEELLAGCDGICGKIEQTFSRTDEDSELYAVNHRKTGRVSVSRPLAKLVQTGLEFYEISGGIFDITIAPVSDLWDFRSGEGSVPDEDRIREAVEKVDASAVHVTLPEDPDGQAYLDFDRPDTMIDLGALVKGYAADQISAYLQEHGVTSGLINLGGNVLAIGSKADGSAWKIGIRKPFDTGIIDTVEVRGRTVVSSGVYERCFEQDGVLYHHILDPKTGYPVRSGLWGVSVICDSSLTGDALSTVCLAAGQEKAEELLASFPGTEVIFIDENLHETIAGKQ